MQNKNIKSLVINATELRHEMRRRDGDIINLGKELKKNLNIKHEIDYLLIESM